MCKGPGAAAGIPCSGKAGKGTLCLLLVSLYLACPQVSGGANQNRKGHKLSRPAWVGEMGTCEAPGKQHLTWHVAARRAPPQPPLPAEAHACPRRAPSWVHTRRGHVLLCPRVHKSTLHSRVGTMFFTRAGIRSRRPVDSPTEPARPRVLSHPRGSGGAQGRTSGQAVPQGSRLRPLSLHKGSPHSPRPGSGQSRGQAGGLGTAPPAAAPPLEAPLTRQATPQGSGSQGRQM